RRALMQSGEMQKLIDSGVRGVTSNPSIFEKAIAKSDDYDEQLQQWAEEDRSLREIYEALIIADIQQACDLF
ncbi:MAG: transaldolase, partial [Desulfuromonadales bacterium]|nr:transaldolase [Desulfuromonadales bacterium]NIS41340.1 transaldolase [Desulfuromonadales bacterium]